MGMLGTYMAASCQLLDGPIACFIRFSICLCINMLMSVAITDDLRVAVQHSGSSTSCIR